MNKFLIQLKWFIWEKRGEHPYCTSPSWKGKCQCGWSYPHRRRVDYQVPDWLKDKKENDV